LKFAFANGSSVSLNGYYEFQFYPSDLRSQLNLMNGGSGTVSRTQGFQAFPPLFEADPALQLTVSGQVPIPVLDGIPRLMPKIPGLSQG
jgi:hypothetical protein